MGQLGRLRELLSGLSVSASSDDGLVEVELNGVGEVRLQLHDGALGGQAEKDLEHKINRVIGDAMWRMHIACRELTAQTFGLD
jgi:hypothetical protein